jgi:hypothetical protein
LRTLFDRSFAAVAAGIFRHLCLPSLEPALLTAAEL